MKFTLRKQSCDNMMCQLKENDIVLLEIMDEFGNIDCEALKEVELEFILMKYEDETFMVEDCYASVFDEFCYEVETSLSSAEIDKLVDEYDNKTIDNDVLEHKENSNVTNEKEAKRNNRNRQAGGEQCQAQDSAS